MQVEAVLTRAESATELGIRYRLGKGGMNPGSPTPAAGGFCDCSGFVAWCFSMSRKSNENFYKHFNGGWMDTTAIWTDVGNSVGIFSELTGPKAGAIVVYPDANGKQGHIGIMVNENKVVHCSGGNDKRHGNAILITGPDVFLARKDVRFGWLNGLH